MTEIFSKTGDVELTSTFLTLQRFGPSPSPNFKLLKIKILFYAKTVNESFKTFYSKFYRTKIKFWS